MRPEVKTLLNERYALVDELVRDPELVEPWKCRRSDVKADLEDASQFSQYMESHLPLHVCAVCGMCRGSADLASQSCKIVRGSLLLTGLELLRRDGPKYGCLCLGRV